MATTSDTVIKQDRLEELAEMYNANLQTLAAELITAAAAFEKERSYSVFLTVLTCTEHIDDAMRARTAMRTHSDSFQQRYPDRAANAALNVS